VPSLQLNAMRISITTNGIQIIVDISPLQRSWTEPQIKV